MNDELDTHSVAAALAEISGVGQSVVPVPAAGGGVAPWTVWQEWLATRNLGLVPVREPGHFRWAGHFLAVVRSDAGRRGVVMFGVPPGVVSDPAGGELGEVEAAWVVAPLNLAAAVSPASARPAGVGLVEAIAIAPSAEAPMRVMERATAIPGRGLEGDRYARGEGTFSGGTGVGRALTLIEAEVLDELSLADGSSLSGAETRRNIVVRGIALEALLGRRFLIGDVECVGRRRCEPCAHLERLTRPGALRALVHRGGLRADITSAGEIELGAVVRGA